MKTRVLLVDDHALVRAGLAKLVAAFSGCEVVAEAVDGREALRLARQLAPDVVLLDVSMPGLNGLDACERMGTEAPGTRVVLLSMHASEEFVLAGLRAGARGYVLKDAAPEELEQALDAVMRGDIYLSPQVTGHVVEQLRRGERTTEPAKLTTRQREVLQLIAEGKSTREIAMRLHVSIKTVETHRAQIAQRLGIRDVAGLTRYAMRIGLVPPDR